MITRTPSLFGQPPLDMRDGHTGVILRLDEPFAQTAIAAYGQPPLTLNQAGPPSGIPSIPSGRYSDCGRLCGLMGLATVILHELVHLCAESPNLESCARGPGGPLTDCPSPGAADDAFVCWAVQNMSGISFQWAMAQKYPALQALACCPKVSAVLGRSKDRYFMTSEPSDENGIPKECMPWRSDLSPC